MIYGNWVMIYLVFFTLGISIGSFLNVVILRGVKNEPIRGRSYCPHCKKTLGFIELIPVLSFIIQKGRCRSCGAALSWQYPAVELFTGFFYTLASWYIFSHYGWSGRSLLYLLQAFAVIGAAIVVFVSDLRFQIIPNSAVVVIFLLGISASFQRAYLPSARNFYSSFFGPQILADFLAAAVFALMLGAIWFFSRGRGMGFGDVKLILATSLLLGYPVSLAAFLFSFWIGAFFSIFLLAFEKAGLKSRIPFGPFILIGSFLAYFLASSFLYFFTF